MADWIMWLPRLWLTPNGMAFEPLSSSPQCEVGSNKIIKNEIISLTRQQSKCELSSHPPLKDSLSIYADTHKLPACAESLREPSLSSLGLQRVVWVGGDFLPTGHILARAGQFPRVRSFIGELFALSDSPAPSSGTSLLDPSPASRNWVPAGLLWPSAHGMTSGCFF